MIKIRLTLVRETKNYNLYKDPTGINQWYATKDLSQKPSPFLDILVGTPGESSKEA